jgi:hypothetical protein
MRAQEFLNELRKKKAKEPQVGDTTQHDHNPGWENLNWLKENAKQCGERLAGRYQLFVPRTNALRSAQTSRDRRLANLANQWAWDENNPTQLKPDYEKWEKGPKELSPTGQPDDQVSEAAPILAPGKAVTPPGRNKPNANFWTSTGRKTASGWTSEWANWVYYNQRNWFSSKGYLYKVRPGALILELNDSQDAERVFRAFSDLGRTNKPPDYYQGDREGSMRATFPWDQIVRHFDGVWHSGYSDQGFMYGWDVESTAWFDTSFLQLVGEVPVAGSNDDDDR